MTPLGFQTAQGLPQLSHLLGRHYTAAFKTVPNGHPTFCVDEIGLLDLISMRVYAQALPFLSFNIMPRGKPARELCAAVHASELSVLASKHELALDYRVYEGPGHRKDLQRFTQGQQAAIPCCVSMTACLWTNPTTIDWTAYAQLARSQ